MTIQNLSSEKAYQQCNERQVEEEARKGGREKAGMEEGNYCYRAMNSMPGENRI
jgi:hypothetical protein